MRLEGRSLRNRPAALVVAALMAATVVVTGNISGPSEAAHASSTHAMRHAVTKSRQAVKFRAEMRKLWEDHIIWTRMFIVSGVAELPDTDTAAGRLLANQDHIGDAIKPFYGKAAGEQLSSLLRDHILIAAELLQAAKSGDSDAVGEANTRWHANADEIADFLHGANKANWPRGEMRTMMAEHLEWTLAEAVARLTSDWDGDVKAFDRIHRDILHMADMLSSGIIKQFPERF